MNERIKLLAEQAQQYAEWTTPQGLEWFDAFKEKFAELLVKECIAKVEMRKIFAIEDEHIVDHAFDLLVYDLKSHFGVRE